ncbi:MAG: IPT/TIG domain-containing protein [Actinomycetota bacterium]
MALMAMVLIAGVTAAVAPPASATAPTVSSLSPNKGSVAGGTIVTIKGSDFTGTTGVNFGTVAATSFAIVSDNQIVAQAPAAAAAGDVLVEVTNATGPNTTGAQFKYNAAEVKSITPAWADPSTASVHVIAGSGFTGAVAADVLFGTHAAAAIWVVSDTQIIATSPISGGGTTIANGEVDLTVTRNSVASATSDKSKFLFTPGAPTVTLLGVSGTEVDGTDDVAVGATMTITGTQLWAVKQINFGSTKVTNAADITVAADGLTLTVVVPSKSNGPSQVTVQNAAGTSETGLKTEFNYYSSVAPKITSLSRDVFDKTAATGGGTFLVSGSGFTGVGTTEVDIICGGTLTPTSVIPVSDRSLIVTTPGNTGDAAATCDLKIDNPVDNTLTVTLEDAIRFV